MRRTLLVCALWWLSGCQGALDAGEQGRQSADAPSRPSVSDPFVTPTGDASAPDLCEGIQIAAAPTALRRLSVEEQRNTYRDLLGDATLNPTLVAASGAIITENEVEALNTAAAALVAKNGHLTFLPCDAAGAFNASCANAFIADFGKYAFRRPLTEAEKKWLREDIYDALRNDATISPAVTFKEAIASVAQAILQSPQLLYVQEKGLADASLPAGIKRLSGFERATRLAYLIWRTTPDKTLLDAAQAGQLDQVTGMKAQAERLLASPRAKGALRAFVSSWLALDGNSHQASLEAAPKSATAFPMDSPALRAAMREELLSFYEQVFSGPKSSFQELMTSRKAYVNKTLGQIYGVASPPASDTTFAWVDLKAEERAGLFTRAGFLALYAPKTQKSPVRRGVFIFREALCQEMGDPPADVNNVPVPPVDHALTQREMVEARTASATCQACHARINPVGFAMETYDAIGRYKMTESAEFNGQTSELAVNPAASIFGTDFDGPVTGPVQLSEKLGQSGMAHDCMASTWFEQAHDRKYTAVDACNLQRSMQRFRQTDDMRDLVLTLATDDSALFIQETP